MRKLLFIMMCIVVITVFTVRSSDAALPATLVWEVRTDGNDSNGGCVVGGTSPDYTVQAAAQLALTDLAAAQSSTTLTSATGGFTAEMANHCIQITAGTNFVVGFYQITVFTNGNTVTLDRAPATAGAGSDGTGRVGGALLTIGKALNGIVAGNDIYVKEGTYSISAELSMVTAGLAQGDPSRLIGYGATRGDNVKPLITTNSAIVMLDMEANYQAILNFELDGNDVATTCIDGNARGVIRNVNVHECTTSGIFAASAFAVSRAEVWDLTAGCTRGIGTLGSVLFSYVHDNPCVGINAEEDGVFFNISESNTGDGFDISGGTAFATVVGNIAFNNGGDGFDIANSVGFISPLFNNIAVQNTGYGFNFSQPNAQFWGGYNAVFGNTAGNYNNVSAGEGHVTLTGSPFVDGPNGNFALNNTGGAGADLRSAGFPGTFPGGLSVGYVDIGPIQAQPTAAGDVNVLTIGGETPSTYIRTQVQAELQAAYLNELLKDPVSDMSNYATDSLLPQLMTTTGDPNDFSKNDDSLQGLKGQVASVGGDVLGIVVNGVELSTQGKTDVENAVWIDAAARALTELDEDNTTIDLNATSVDVGSINGVAAAAVRLALSAGTMVPGTVDDAAFPPTSTAFETNLTEATASHYIGRVIIFTTGDLTGQATTITGYELSGGRGKFTVDLLTEAPANGDTFIIV